MLLNIHATSLLNALFSAARKAVAIVKTAATFLLLLLQMQMTATAQKQPAGKRMSTVTPILPAPPQPGTFNTASAILHGKQLKFEHLQTNDGLSQSHVMSIIQDSRGFIWFGTGDGLNKYDGYNFTVYKNDPNNKKSISNNYISEIAESDSGNLWIATWGGGVNYFERRKGTFLAFKHKANDANSVSSNFITTIREDRNGNVWIGTEADGLDVYDKRKHTFTHYKYSDKNDRSVSDNYIRTIYQDRESRVWVGTTQGGLNLFDDKTKSFTRFAHNDRLATSLTNNDVHGLFEDSKQRLWIATNGGGLDMFDEKNNRFLHYKNDSRNPNSLPANRVYTINEDAAHNIWAGTENGGLSILNPETGIFNTYLYDPIDNSSLSNNSIYSICRDNKNNMWIGTFSGGVNFLNRDNQFVHYKHTTFANSLSDNKILCIQEGANKKIWIGTDGGGLNLFDPVSETFTHYLHDPANRNSICGNYVLSVCEDSHNNLWIGTWGDGITVYNKKNNTYRHFKNDPADPTSLSSNNAWTICEDNDKNIWVGTFGGGVNKFNPATGTFTRCKYDNTNTAKAVNSNKIYSIMDDGKGHLYIGTYGGGLNVMDKKTSLFKQYLHDDKKNSPPSNVVGHLYQDKKGTIWVATSEGLSEFNPQTGRFTNYTTRDGLPNNNVFGIIEDDDHSLWVSTNKGISRFDPTSRIFKNFGVVDGLQGNEFKEQAFCKSSSGSLYFGGNNGFNVFNPKDIKPDPFQPSLVLTNFLIFNKEVPIALPGTSSPLKADITEAKEIVLPFSSSVFEFEFASLNYVSAEKKQYAYKLEGFDNGWNYVGNKRIATYTNLNPGHYTFLVKGSDNQGSWSEKGISFSVVILPPWWMTWWFRLCVVLMVIGSASGFYLFRINTIKAQKRKLEQTVQQQTAQLQTSTAQLLISNEEERKARLEADDANRAKSVFLATMSHEIRTPMNGVIGMAALLMQTELNSEQKSYAKIISTSGENLLSVINSILDFSKIESGKMELESKVFHLENCIQESLDIFFYKASEAGIKLRFVIDKNVPAWISGDSLRLRQVLINLVGNAMKFTVQGEVLVAVHLAEKAADGSLLIKFEVRDTGIGIEASKLERLFKAFSQVDASTTRKHGGTGLGLIICEKLVTLMGGSIKVESEYGKGTVFTFTISSKLEDQLLPEAKKTEAEARKSRQLNKAVFSADLARQYPLRILVAEDNAINALIINKMLGKLGYEIVTAENGLKVLEALDDRNFDLILMDVQMPEMDGLEATIEIRRKYKEPPLIIAMTANAMEGDRDKCIEAGMNDYLSKPINLDSLVAMLKKCGEQIMTA